VTSLTEDATSAAMLILMPSHQDYDSSTTLSDQFPYAENVQMLHVDCHHLIFGGEHVTPPHKSHVMELYASRQQ
jgi:hypothetical protein